MFNTDFTLRGNSKRETAYLRKFLFSAVVLIWICRSFRILLLYLKRFVPSITLQMQTRCTKECLGVTNNKRNIFSRYRKTWYTFSDMSNHIWHNIFISSTRKISNTIQLKIKIIENWFEKILSPQLKNTIYENIEYTII